MKLIRLIFGPLTTTKQSFDGRRTLSNRGLILFIVLAVLAFALHSQFLATIVFFLLIGGGLSGASLTARDFRNRK